jgi:hypothetical protein
LHPVTRNQHPVTRNQHPVSSNQHPVSSILSIKSSQVVRKIFCRKANKL